MPQVIRMPSEAELPHGQVREFVKMLFWLYTQAGRPTLDGISAHIRDSDYPGTASKETIRRMLRGTTVPPRWETTEAVASALTQIAPFSPDDPINVNGRQMTVIDHVKRLWNEALDHPLAGGHELNPWEPETISWPAFNEPAF